MKTISILTKNLLLNDNLEILLVDTCCTAARVLLFIYDKTSLRCDIVLMPWFWLICFFNNTSDWTENKWTKVILLFFCSFAIELGV